MNTNDVSRRGFLSAAVAVGTPGAPPANDPATQFPERAWIVLEQHWEHNDEFNVPHGEYAHFQLYYCKAEADAACQRLNEAFFAVEPPDDYLDEMETYLAPGTYDHDEVTWDQLRAAGYPGPYSAQALHTHPRKPTA